MCADGVQDAREIPGLALGSLHFPAGGSRQSSRVQKNDIEYRYLEIGRDGLSYRFHNLLSFALAVAANFMRDDHFLVTVQFSREGGAAVGLQRRVRTCGREFEILWIKVATAYDDDVPYSSYCRAEVSSPDIQPCYP